MPRELISLAEAAEFLGVKKLLDDVRQSADASKKASR